ncbi:HNH endonuclease [Paenisporosarcina sp. TG20]|uniref:HNH endonuclease n=1 Tax=Paenisporosarcina sp. TG20 TaxID=1211706 RepID=UPI00036C19F3|nr:HNH endonuclease signature motif containing protein [Paenisporosarcina sp. TG20]
MSKTITSYVNREKAGNLVQQGAAGIIHKNVIQLFYSKSFLKKMVLERDDYICHYCGNYGDTIDHKTPKVKNGLSTPDNCVCACYSCNQKKGFVDYEVFML